LPKATLFWSRNHTTSGRRVQDCAKDQFMPPTAPWSSSMRANAGDSSKSARSSWTSSQFLVVPPQQHVAVERVAEGPAEFGFGAADGGVAIRTVLGCPLARKVDPQSETNPSVGEGMRPVASELANIAAATAHAPGRVAACAQFGAEAELVVRIEADAVVAEHAIVVAIVGIAAVAHAAAHAQAPAVLVQRTVAGAVPAQVGIVATPGLVVVAEPVVERAAERTAAFKRMVEAGADRLGLEAMPTWGSLRQDVFGQLSLQRVRGSTVMSVTAILATLVLVFLYVTFLLLERSA
jgi:hypothetical protein